jgi:hypothetical protein
MSRGGSRWGAGRPGWHVKAEHCRRIDARRWQREGILQPGRGGGWAWTDAETGKQTASVGYSTEFGFVVLNYTMGDRLMSQRVPILATPCHFGGHRHWFACPNCARRVAVLFLRANGFFCRRCNRVVYGSQSDDALGRAWRKQSKIESRLDEHWQRPKGMHQTTYAKLTATIMDCEELRDAALVMAFGRLFPGHTIDDLLGR